MNVTLIFTTICLSVGVWRLNEIGDSSGVIGVANIPNLQSRVEHGDDQEPAVIGRINLAIDFMDAKARSLATKISRGLRDIEDCDRPGRSIIGYVDQKRVFPRLPKAVVGRLFRGDRQQIPFLRFAVEKILLLFWYRHSEDWDSGMAALVGIGRDITDLWIEQVGLGWVVSAIRRSSRDRATGQQLLAVNNLKDAVAVDTIGKVHAIFGRPRRIYLVNASGWIGNAFITIRPGRIVTALRRSNVGAGLLPDQSELADEYRARRIA